MSVHLAENLLYCIAHKAGWQAHEITLFDDGQAHAWTFAGGRINRTLRYVFEHVGGFKVTSDYFQIKMEGDKVTHEAIFKIIDQMRSPSFGLIRRSGDHGRRTSGIPVE